MRCLLTDKIRKSISILSCTVVLMTSVFTGECSSIFGQENTIVEINGYQISVNANGFRTIYSVSGEAVQVGLIYGLDKYADDTDMVVGSSNSYIYKYDATEAGKSSVLYSSLDNSQSYIMTMKNIDSAAFYKESLLIRAYAKTNDGSYVYSNVSSLSVYEIAEYLYVNGLMESAEAHEYLYERILSLVNPSYDKIDYNGTGSVASPDDIMKETTVAEEETTQGIQDNHQLTVTASTGTYSFTESNGIEMLSIDTAGTYRISGGTDTEPATNVAISVASDLSDNVSITLDNIHIDNSALGAEEGQDKSVVTVGSGTQAVNIAFVGDNVIKGNGSYSSEPVAVICADDTATTMTISGTDSNASLSVTDSMSKTTEFSGLDPADGIYCKGTLIIGKGHYTVESNGDCLKGTGKKGKGGVTIEDGTLELTSRLSNGIRSKNGVISITGGTINVAYSKADGVNAKNNDVNILGGTLNIDNCYGDGIQGETVNISGDNTVVDIKTYYEYAGKNFYNSELGTGNYNTISTSGSQNIEVVNVDTGSHKAIKGGTKAESFSYASVEDGSDYEAGVTYTNEASGGIVISGGTITVDTTNAGIKYNGSSGGMGVPGGSSSSSGNISAANSEGQYIIGSPDDGIHSNNTCVISGGKIDVYASDDGITGPQGVTFTNECDITIHTCYEGIEGGEIVVGTENDTTAGPRIKVYSNDDGINAAKKDSVMNEFTDEFEEQYTRTETASSGNTMKVYSGYVNVMIGDDQEHTVTLPYEGQTDTEITYTSNGDGIDCNGSFYAYGGTVIVYGSTSSDNGSIDTDDTYYIGSGVTLLAVGSGGMETTPTCNQAYIKYSGSSSGSNRPGGGMGGFPGGSQGSSGSSLSGAFGIMNGSNTILSISPIKSYAYIFYTSPELASGTSYSLYSGGTVSGSLIQSDSSAYDYRYTEYSTTSATSLGSVTAN